MEMQGPAGILYNIVKSQLGASASLIDIDTQVQAVAAAAGIPDAVADEVLTRFRAELQSAGSKQDVAPRLLVDWGELPRVGNQVRPEFSLLCPKYSSKPELNISVDRDLAFNNLVEPAVVLFDCHQPVLQNSCTLGVPALEHLGRLR